MDSHQQSFAAANNQPSFQQNFNQQGQRGRGFRRQWPENYGRGNADADIPALVFKVIFAVVSGAVTPRAVTEVPPTVVVPTDVTVPVRVASLLNCYCPLLFGKQRK